MIKEIIKKVSDQHPYSVHGKPETYDQYNQGWEDACAVVEEQLTKEIIASKDRFVESITSRILDDHQKHSGWSDKEWAKIAAIRIFDTHIKPS